MRLFTLLAPYLLADQNQDDLEGLEENQVSYDLSEELLDRKGNPLKDYTIVVGGAASAKVYGVSSLDGDIKWTKSVGEGVNSVPVISQAGVSYLTAEDDCLYAIEVESGKRLWKFETDDTITGGVTLSRDELSVFVSDASGMVYMISVEAETPQIRWKRQINGEPSSPIVHDIDEEKVYFGVQSEVDQSGHDIFALNTSDGTVAWTHRLKDIILFPFISFDNDLLLLSYNEGILYEIVRETGQRKLPTDGHKIETPSDSFPILDARKGIVYFARQESGIAVLNLNTRHVDFFDEMNGRLILTAITLCSGQWGNDYVDKNWLYFGTRRCTVKDKPTQKNPKHVESQCYDEMVKYDMDKGDIVWATELDSTAAAGAPVIDNWGQVIFSSEDGKTYSLNAMSGEEIWSQHTGNEVLNGLAMSEDMTEPRCAGATIHFMDELVLMEKMMEEMFAMDDVEQVEELDIKKARANMNADPDELDAQAEEIKAKLDANAEKQPDSEKESIREEL